MHISVGDSIFKKIPHLKSNYVVCENMRFRESTRHELYDGLNELFSRLRGHKSLNDKKEIAEYQELLSELGLAHAEVSTSSMVKLIVEKKKDLILNHPIIDFYNYFSLHHLIPIGAYDLDRIQGDLVMRDSVTDDMFQKLGTNKKISVDKSVVMADSQEVLCVDWVHKQSDNQKIRPNTKYVLFRIESLRDEVENAKILHEFIDLISKYFEFDSCEFKTLDKDNTSIKLALSEEAIARQERFVDYTDILSRGVSDVIVYDDLIADLIDGKKLKIKHGVDPTKRSLTFGHAVNYEKLRQFQERGHEIQFLIGSFTAMFGDPTDKSESRTIRTREEVMDMAKNYIDQVTMILDKEKLKIFYNDAWYSNMPIEEFLRLLAKTTVARMLERDMFQKRMADGREIGLHELIYPLLQGYDSVEMKSDLTVIGTDQTFNELQARPLQKEAGLNQQNIISMKMLLGTDGKLLMSQSQGNFIALDDSSKDKFGKLMSIPDSAIEMYANALSRYSRDELKALFARLDSGENPRNIKMELAHHIVTNFDGVAAANQSREDFKEVFQNKGLPTDIPKFAATSQQTVLEILQLSNLVSSGSEARRMIAQGAVKLHEGDKIQDLAHTFESGFVGVLQVGKRKFLNLSVE